MGLTTIVTQVCFDGAAIPSPDCSLDVPEQVVSLRSVSGSQGHWRADASGMVECAEIVTYPMPPVCCRPSLVTSVSEQGPCLCLESTCRYRNPSLPGDFSRPTGWLPAGNQLKELYQYPLQSSSGDTFSVDFGNMPLAPCRTSEGLNQCPLVTGFHLDCIQPPLTLTSVCPWHEALNPPGGVYLVFILSELPDPRILSESPPLESAFLGGTPGHKPGALQAELHGSLILA